MVNKNIVQLEQFRAEKNQESMKMNELKMLQIGYYTPDSNDLVEIIAHLIRFQEITKWVVGEEIYKVIVNELEKE